MSQTQSPARRPADAPARRVSLRDRAYAEIKRRINCLSYAPGAYINEAQVSRADSIWSTSTRTWRSSEATSCSRPRAAAVTRSMAR